ncbi:hypothetical protein J5N97_014227 [Dioscorea zingiberensis]|uniref:Uncharacterized protein n=1 Tax=Dioscorea zingiberensis TaxID=325984 RepID=A0A9D5HJK5_9LILI|nr:hypothetical protein J5N97_014227 [Dioscorea zingiberensis]
MPPEKIRRLRSTVLKPSQALIKSSSLQPLEPGSTLMPLEDGYQVESSTSSKNSITATKELFQLVTCSHESSPSSMSYVPLPQLTYGVDCGSSRTASSGLSNPLHWFSQSSGLMDISPEFNCSSISTTVIPSAASSVILPTSMGLIPPPGIPSYWEAGHPSSNSSGSTMNSAANGIEMQSGSSFFDNSIFQWSDLTASSKEAQAQIQQLESEPEDLKWSEYLQGTFSMSGAIQSQSQSQSHSEPLYNDMKTESQFENMDGLSSWHQSQHQHQHQHQQQQSPDMYEKDFQRMNIHSF